jgi:tRNA threonylcarbamoyladenosine modification (KEOPS) complex Cgi121 subunit
LLFQLPEFSLHIWVSAFPCKPKDVDDVIQSIHAKFPNVKAQLVDLNKVPGSRYLFLATLNALKSFQSKHAISKSLGMEMLLYAAASRQISEAIRKVGISETTEKTAAMLVGTTQQEVTAAADLLAQVIQHSSSDELIDEWTSERLQNVIQTFDIGSKEISATIRKKETKAQAVERLAGERSALLTIGK